MLRPSPLVSGVTQGLVGMISSGELAPGTGLPSERLLSARFGVSRVVVRFAIEQLESMNLIERKARCRPVVKVAQPLRKKRQKSDSRYISVWLWPSAGDFCAGSILRGIQSYGLPSNLRLVVANAVGENWRSLRDSEEDFLMSLAEDRESAGAIVWYLSGVGNLAALEAVKHAKVPIVFIDRLPPESLNSDFVGTDNEGSFRRAIEYLLQLGHRKIALISNFDKASSVKERELGYRRALNAAGVEELREYCVHVDSDEIQPIRSAVEELLALPNPPTAIVGINDLIALKIHDTLSSLGVAVPSQVSVLGFDGLLRWVPGGGYLTSAWQDFERIGQVAAQLLLERIESPESRPSRHILFDAPLRASSSTDVPRLGSEIFEALRPFETPDGPRVPYLAESGTG